ncbi:hypothetical protein D3Y59_11395 [Hymenobacter oligotrophus]|uniref:DUF2834 domain-containing protein n=2 Tax=Hymenobacter oligotrophus TaxID=2319843 RepID=A0A3B7R9Y4_9BACT|nr:hypothetical protein D3Y59_11395 [Hymenobacter oligotrophus]
MSGHLLTDVWQAAQADWLVAMTLLDGGIFALLSLVWLGHDVRRRGAARWQALAWVAACLIFGAAPLLVYLALRQPERKLQIR